MMLLKYTVDSLDGVEEAHKPLYVEQPGGGFRLAVEGVDSADELREALRKERDDRKAAKAQLAELERQQQDAERQRLEQSQQFEQLSKSERARAEKAERELLELRQTVAAGQRDALITQVVGPLASDAKRRSTLAAMAKGFVQSSDNGPVIAGPDGTMTPEQFGRYLANEYPFLVDGNGATGGGATGGKSGGAGGNKWGDYTSQQLAEIRRTDPARYETLRATR
jgi:multidrug efflux pump subunit AcrA (membrane-fusion protein)